MDDTLKNEIRDLIHTEYAHFLSDVEWRVKQAYDVANRAEVKVVDKPEGGKRRRDVPTLVGYSAEDTPMADEADLACQPIPVGPEASIYAEDMNLSRLALTGYTVTANTPAATPPNSIAWTNLHIVLKGVDYPITDGNSGTNRYVYWDPTMSTSILQKSNTQPVITGDMALIFVNDNGTPRVAVDATVAAAVGAGAVSTTGLNIIKHLLF